MISKKLLLTLLLLAGTARADEQVRAVQEELRRRNVYFGDIDGQRSTELEQATRRYQKRKGFAENGSEDHDTLRSLGLLPRSPDEAPPKELDWPAEPILKSDAKIDVAAEAQQIGAETGVAPASIAPEKIPAEKTSASAAKAKRSKPSGVQPVVLQSERKTSQSSQRMETVELVRFVKNYLKAVSRNDTHNELQFYADHVSYFANGVVDRRIVESSLKRYYQRWPSRKYIIGPVLGISWNSRRGEIVMTYRVNFTLKNHGKVVRGQTENRITINAATADPRIVAIEEHRVRL
ncbi:MAG: peptidoglycan-binding domain-containing protein [Chthoniobacterales bacterium]